MVMLFEKEYPTIDYSRLLKMCIIHDLGEERQLHIDLLQSNGGEQIRQILADIVGKVGFVIEAREQLQQAIASRLIARLERIDQHQTTARPQHPRHLAGGATADGARQFVEQIDVGHQGERLVREGQLLGQMTFSRARDDLIIVDHTEVDDSLQGKGGGGRLFNAMVAWARDTGTRVMSTCPFTLSMFERNPDSRDVLIAT